MIKKLLTNEFNKNVLTLLTGSTIARSIPIIISPILTRLYSPESFGVLTLFIAVTTILGALSTGKYNFAIVLPKKEEDAINLVALSLLISFLYSIGLLIVVILCGHYFLQIDSVSNLSFWIYVIPFVVFLIGLFDTLKYLNTRYKKFDIIAHSNIIKSVSMSVLQIVIGFFKEGSAGLVSGQVFSHVAGNTRMILVLLRDRELLKKISYSKVRFLARKYINFPKFSMWSTFINLLTQNLLSFFIPVIYSLSQLGYYALVQRLLGIPLNLISSSVGQVYHQRASSNAMNNVSNKRLFLTTMIKLLVIICIIFIPLLIVADWLVPLVFGSTWSKVVSYMYFLMPLFVTRFIVVPLSLTNTIYEKQKLDFLWQILFTVVTLLIIGITTFLKVSMDTFLLIYSISVSAVYIVYLLILFTVVSKEE